ncbi:MAG TPA: hypothetical protein VFO34_17100 [Candidatus Acidoferrales bacterium]|nr:hypothetical protein [Candidatus Acidoferrales bacterium]
MDSLSRLRARLPVDVFPMTHIVNAKSTVNIIRKPDAVVSNAKAQLTALAL